MRIGNLFCKTPCCSIPTLVTFLAVLIADMGFIISIRIGFCPGCQGCCDLFGSNNIINSVIATRRRVLTILGHRLQFATLGRLFIATTMLSLRGALLTLLPLKFGSLVRNCFHALYIKCNLCTINGAVLVVLLCFASCKNTITTTTIFTISTDKLATLSVTFSPTFCKFNFLVKTTLFCLMALFQLSIFATGLPCQILKRRPVITRAGSKHFAQLKLFLRRGGQGPAGDTGRDTS